MVPIPHGAVWDIRKASDEIGKLFKSSSLRDEVLLAREAKIGFVLDEIVIGSDISHSALVQQLSIVRREWRRCRVQVKRPECMREQICRELLDKDSVVDPDEMELRFFWSG